MTTKLAVEIPRLSLGEIQRIAAQSYAGLLLSCRDFIRSRLGDDAVGEFLDTLAHNHAQCLKGRGITGALDLVKTLACSAVNVYGSDIEIEGDDSHAVFECKSCGTCNAIKNLVSGHKVAGGKAECELGTEWKGFSPLRYFEIVARDLGFDFKGEPRGDGFRFSVDRIEAAAEDYPSVD